MRLPTKSKSDSKTYNVFQPDVCVICDLTKLDARGGVGAPDIVVEIVSMGNSKRDMKIKFDAYQEAGVKEYWIVSPYDRYVNVNTLHNGKFVISPPLMEGYVQTTPILPDFNINITNLFKVVEIAEMQFSMRPSCSFIIQFKPRIRNYTPNLPDYV